MVKKLSIKLPRKIKVRIPLPKKPPKVITPDTVYDRKKDRNAGIEEEEQGR